jgi:mannose-1-phosphate guanylyltransferase
MVLAAGLGTRLRPLTDELPKPLVPVGDRSMLAHVTVRLRALGFTEVLMNTHHRAGDFASNIRDLAVKVDPIHEPRILGTAGGVAGARPGLAPAPVLVWNSDILTAPPVEALFAAASAGDLVLALAPRARGEGTVGVDARGRVVRLRGERFGEEVESGDYVGVSAIGARALAALPDEGCLVGDYALPTLRRGGAILTVWSRAPWVDVGTIGVYHALNLAWLDRRGAPPEGSWVHPSATVAAGVRPVRSIVGAGAVVTGQGSLERCVVWPGGRATAPLSDSIVTTAGRVVAVETDAEMGAVSPEVFGLA